MGMSESIVGVAWWACLMVARRKGCGRLISLSGEVSGMRRTLLGMPRKGAVLRKLIPEFDDPISSSEKLFNVEILDLLRTGSLH